ncbi:MAG: hypothetical protein AAGC53_14330 [Actinomycetota bacterium]
MDEINPTGSDAGDDGASADMNDLPDGLATTDPTVSGKTAGSWGRRGLVVLAAFALVVAGAVVVAVSSGETDDDAASDGDTEATAEDAESDPDAEATTDESDDEPSTDAAVIDDDGESSDGDAREESGSYQVFATDGGDFYGGHAPMPWGDGFLSIRDEFVPSEQTLDDLIPDLAERFPAEVTEAVQAAGISLGDPGAMEDASAVLEEAGLLEEVMAIFADDPELMRAYSDVLSGGTYVRVAEYSADGITWEPIDFSFEVPEHSWPEFRTDGEHLIAVVTSQTWTDEGRSTDFAVTVHMTSDLVTWTSTELPIELPDRPAYVQVDAWMDQIAVSDGRWYVSAQINQYIDLWSLLPERIQNGSYSWNPTAEGIRIEDWNDVAFQDAMMAAEESGDSAAIEEWEPELVELISWDDLPISYAEWSEGSVGDGTDRAAFVGDMSGSVTSATSPEGLDWYQLASVADGFLAWGQHYTPSDTSLQDLVPDIADRFPQEIIDVLAEAGFEITDANSIEETTAVLADAGLLDLATQTVTEDPELLDAYMEVTSGGTYETQAFFSADGISWTPTTLPDTEWIDVVAPVDGGVVVIANDRDGGQNLYVGDPQSGTWEAVDGPDIGQEFWYSFDPRVAGGDGLATVIDMAQRSEPQFVAWSGTAEQDGFEITLSADGEGSQSLRIVDTATGETVRDVTIAMWSAELYQWADDSIDFTDDDGEIIVSIPMEAAEDLIWGPESAAWEAFYKANPYVPELVLVATTDGRDWIVQPLEADANEDGHYYGGSGAAINNGVVVYRDTSGWHRVVVD